MISWICLVTSWLTCPLPVVLPRSWEKILLNGMLLGNALHHWLKTKETQYWSSHLWQVKGRCLHRLAKHHYPILCSQKFSFIHWINFIPTNSFIIFMRLVNIIARPVLGYCFFILPEVWASLNDSAYLILRDRVSHEWINSKITVSHSHHNYDNL